MNKAQQSVINKADTLTALLYEKTKIHDQLNTDDSKVSGSSSFEAIIEKTRDYLSQYHASELSAVITDENANDTVHSLITTYLSNNKLSLENKSLKQLSAMVYSELVIFGFLTKYIHDPDIEEINGNAWNDIEIVANGKHVKLKEKFSSPQRAIDTIRKMARIGGLIIDYSTPIIDSFIEKGVRLSAAIAPVVDDDTGVSFSIRKQRMARTTKEQIVDEWKTASTEELEFLTLCLNNGVSVGIAGATSSGKTTDLSYLLNNIDPNKRIYTIEETRELDLTKYDEEGNIESRVVHLKTRESHDAKLSVDSQKLLRHALRFNPDVIVPAEMRGAEAMIAQEAARTGHAIATTLHANNAREAYDRILSMCLMARTEIADTSLARFIARAFPIMVFKRQMPDGSRKLLEIVEAVSVDDSEVVCNTIFYYNQTTGEHVRSDDISPRLAQQLLDMGANKEDIRKFYCGEFYRTGKSQKEACNL